MGRTRLASDRSKAHLSKLHERKHNSEKRKRELITYLERLKNRYNSNEISYARYVEIIHQKRNGRTIEEWIHYFHLESLECHRKINEIKKSRRNRRIVAVLLISFLLIAFVSFISNSQTIVGFFTQDLSPSQDFSLKNFHDNLDEQFSESSVYTWNLENTGRLNSVKLSGSIEGEGEVKVYLDDLIILDSSNIKKVRTRSITAFAIENDSYSENTEESSLEDSSPSQEDSSLSENSSSDNTREVPQEDLSPSQEEPSLSETNKSYSNEEESSLEDSSPSQEDSSSSSDTIRFFEEHCDETCLIAGLNLTDDSYELKIEVDGVVLNLDTVDYQLIFEGAEEFEEEVEGNKTQKVRTDIVSNATVKTVQHQIVLGQLVRWTKEIKLDKSGSVKVKVPKFAQNISAYKINKREASERSATSFSEVQRERVSITGMAISNPSDDSVILRFFRRVFGAITGRVVSEDIEILIEDNSYDYELEYYTVAPTAVEENISGGKRVTINGPDELHYQNILAFSELEKELKHLKLYHIVDGQRVEVQFNSYDNNGNGLIDYIEWGVPHLSTQIYEIIEITRAEHLDENRTFIEDVYLEVKELDDVWSPSISDGHYVRIWFEENLTFENDITIYPRTVNGTPRIEIYEINGSEIIAEFSSIKDNEYNKVYLTGLNGSQDSFDLKILDGSVEFDYIVDPTPYGTVIQIYDSTFGQDADTVIISHSLDLETVIDSPYDHNLENLTFNEAGWYKISYGATWHSTGATSRHIMANWIEKNSTKVVPSETRCYVRYNTSEGDHCSNAATLLVNASAGDYIQLMGDKDHGAAGATVTVADAWIYAQKVERDVVQIYDSTGGQALSNISITANLDSETKLDTGYNFATDTITVSYSGWYKIYYTLNSHLTVVSDRRIVQTWLRKNQNENITASNVYSYIRDEGSGDQNHNTGYVLANLAANDEIDLRVMLESQDGTGNHEIMENMSWMLIEKISSADILQVYVDNGDQQILEGATDPINFSADSIVGASFTHSQPNNITFNTGGWYEVSYVYSWDDANIGNRHLVATYLRKNGATTIQPSKQIDCTRGISDGLGNGRYNSNAGNFIINVSAGDYIELMANPTGGYINTEPNGSVLTIISLDIGNLAPTHTAPILNSTFGTNLTSENLTCYNQSTVDFERDSVKNIFNWYKDDVSLTVLNMPFEGNLTAESGTKVRDYSSNANNGSGIGSPVWNSSGGYDGKGAYEFNGASDYLNVSSDLSAWLGTTATLTAWIKTTQTGSDTNWQAPGITGVEQAGGDNDIFWGLIDVSGDIGVVKGNTWIKSTGAINDGNWHFVAFSWNQTDGAVQIYIDGILNNSGTTGTGAATTPFHSIGRIEDTGGSPEDFDGTIDDLMVFNSVLSAEQISAIYNNRTDLIVSQETNGAGENWTCEVTPNDGTQDGTTLLSNNLTILKVSVDNPPNVTLDYLPVGYVNDTSQYVNLTFNATVTDDSQLVNCSLWHNTTGTWHLNQTESVTGTSNTTEFNLTNLENVAFIWNIECYDNASLAGWGDANRTVTLNWTGDMEYPIFSNYWDNNASLIDSGIGYFNVTVLSTNGTVFLEIDGANYTTSSNLWTPTEITTTAWFDANDTSMIINGSAGNISEWKDKSGNGDNITQTNVSQQPTYMNGINGNPSVYFNDTLSQFLKGTGVNIDVELIVFVATMDTGVISSLAGIISTDGDKMNIRRNGEGYRDIGASADGNDVIWNDGNQWIDGTDGRLITYDVPHILSLDKGSIPSVGNYPDLAMGRASAGLGRYWRGNIGELIMTENTADREKLEGYLAWKWGLEGDLPADHTYKSVVPNNGVYNVSVSFTTGGVYDYYWGSWGNGTEENYNVSGIRYYTVNSSANQAPTHTTPILNSTLGTNLTSENLTCYNQSTTDVDSDSVKNIFNWYKNDVSLQVLNMPFESGSNSTWTKDYSEFGNNGTVTGATWNSSGGYDGKGAYEFGSSGDKVTISNSDSLNITDEVTLMVWAKLKACSTIDGVFISKSTASVDNPFPLAYALWYEGDGACNTGDLDMCINLGDNAGASCLEVENGVNPENIWTHYAGTFNGTELRLYRDGVLIGNKSYVSSIVNGSDADLFIGKAYSTGSQYINGTIDDVQIFNRSLSAEQISALYNNRTDLIVSQETSAGENWTCEVTPNDEYQDGTSLMSNNLTIISAANQAPTVTYVSPIANVNPIEAGVVNVTFYATINDNDGTSDIDTITANFTRAGEPVRENLSCVNVSDITSTSGNYSCTIDMWYFDEAGDWNITVWANDSVSNSGINTSTYFQLNQLSAIVINPSSINFNINAGATNQSATDDPIAINNTGNANLTNNIAINSTNLLGETVPTDYIAVENFSVNIADDCDGTTLQNATEVNITGVILERGNLSAGQAQEELYFCIKETGTISAQTYSTQGAGSWLIKIVLSLILVSNKKRKRRKLLIDDLSIPASVFETKLGALEALSKYLKENLGLAYSEIAELLNRDDRTIWTSYNKSAKKNITITIKANMVFIPVSIFKNRKLTVLESMVVYLKNKGMKYVEIGDLLNRDQRNIWTVFSRSMKK